MELNTLIEKAGGIKIMLFDTRNLKKEQNRQKYRKNIYSMMLISRKINSDTEADSKLISLLSFFLRSYAGEITDKIITEYIKGLKDNEVSTIVRTVLSYKPVEKYDIPEYEQVADALISA